MKFRAWPTVWLAFGISLSSCNPGLAAAPCPPPQISVEGGTSVSTPCESVSAGAYSTSFNLTENPISEGGKWITGKDNGLDWNSPESASGYASASVQSGASGSRYDDTLAHLSTSFQAFNADQYAEGTVYLASDYSARHEVELLLRFSITPHDAHGYEVLWSLVGNIAVVRWNGPLGNYTPLFDPGKGSMPVAKDGDVLRAEISGNIITVTLNGSTVATVDVTARGGTVWSSGQPGIGFWPVDGSTPGNYGWKSFEAGNLASAEAAEAEAKPLSF